LAYCPTGHNFILYNVGPNRVDDSGDSRDDYHFWPPSARWVGSVKY
jgi:hypothetical protein